MLINEHVSYLADVLLAAGLVRQADDGGWLIDLGQVHARLDVGMVTIDPAFGSEALQLTVTIPGGGPAVPGTDSGETLGVWTVSDDRDLHYQIVVPATLLTWAGPERMVRVLE